MQFVNFRGWPECKNTNALYKGNFFQRWQQRPPWKRGIILQLFLYQFVRLDHVLYLFRNYCSIIKGEIFAVMCNQFICWLVDQAMQSSGEGITLLLAVCIAFTSSCFASASARFYCAQLSKSWLINSNLLM